jgi:peptidoglycan hydrolase CwlO-like protein
MKNIFLVIASIIAAASFSSCSNKTTTTESSTTKAEEANIKRPEKTEEKLSDQVYKFDSKVADVSSTLSELKENIEKGAKVTPKIEENFHKMVADAKKLREPIIPQSDKLAAEEFRQFDRDKDWIDELDAEFEAVKQTGTPSK